MSDQAPSEAAAATPAFSIPIDAVARLFEEREQSERNRALLLAAQVRDLTTLAQNQADTIQAQAGLIEELRKPKDDGEAAEAAPAPKPRSPKPAAAADAVN